MSSAMRAACLLLCIVFAVPAVAAKELPATAPQVRVGLGLTKPPYVLESGEGGVELEIAEQAFAAAGYKMVPLQFPPARGVAMLVSGQIDAMLGVDEGIGDGYFSDPYLDYHNVAVTLTSRHIALKRIEDLAHYSVASFQNAHAILGERFKAIAAHHSAYREYSQQIIQNKLLYTGRVDVVVGDRRIFRYFSTQLEASINARQAVTFHEIFPASPRKAAFRDPQLRNRFNAGLKIIQRNGVYAGILKKYPQYTQR